MGPPTSPDKGKLKNIQRKLNKPLIEKRRRARINECLTQLKEIVLEANKDEAHRPSKLEKADILEMTVDFVKSRLVLYSDVDARNAITPPSDAEKEYLAGYSKCLEEITTFLEYKNNSHTLPPDIFQPLSAKLGQKNVDQSTSIDVQTLQSAIVNHVSTKLEQNHYGAGPQHEQTQSSNETNQTLQEATIKNTLPQLKQHPSAVRVSCEVFGKCKQVPVLPVKPQYQAIDFTKAKPTHTSETDTTISTNINKTCPSINNQIHLEAKPMTSVQPNYILPAMLQPSGLLCGGQFMLLQINPTTVPQTTTCIQWNTSVAPVRNTDTSGKKVLTNEADKLANGNGSHWRPW
ncbi:uncharacterized protein LOC128203632 [Mya arenaria]|uniref:uncharacterized protein LOC128203632 n=1 Tax=Mya arenaria TaxID=6604 RepID=UPI0022DFAEDD|nr:uncharacterized protein LOC128203632 [Mya arenaria]